MCYAASLAVNDGYDLYFLTFTYGQRAEREIERSRYFAKVLNAKDLKVADMGFMKSLYNKSNALTDGRQEISQEFSPSLIVPIRNAVFLTIATAWAMSIDAKVVAYGAHTGDTLHYPDCRPSIGTGWTIRGGGSFPVDAFSLPSPPSTTRARVSSATSCETGCRLGCCCSRT